jgi:hypothetical protein
VVFKAEPEEAGPEDAPLVPPGPGDEPPHAAASNAAATNTIAAGQLFRIDLSLHQQRPARGTRSRPRGRITHPLAYTAAPPACPRDRHGTYPPHPAGPAHRRPRHTRYPI